MSFSNLKTIGPGDEIAISPSLERLVDVSFEGGEIHYEPSLCKSYEMDLDAKTLTFELHEGVKFHDGPRMTAEVVVWNFNLSMQYGKVPEIDLIDKIEATGPYTVESLEHV
jgi:ABC-type transport system substrate-binding protein